MTELDNQTFEQYTMQVEKTRQEYDIKIQTVFNRLESNCLESQDAKSNPANQVDIRLRLKLPVTVMGEKLWKPAQNSDRNTEWELSLNNNIGDIAYKHTMARYSYDEKQRLSDPSKSHIVDMAVVYQIQQRYYAWTIFEANLSQIEAYRSFSKDWHSFDTNRETPIFGGIETERIDDIHFVLYSTKALNKDYISVANAYFSYDTMYPNISCDARGNVEVSKKQLQTMLSSLQIPCDVDKDLLKPQPIDQTKERTERER